MQNKFSLVGIDGNAFSLMGYTASCMKKVGYSKEEIEGYRIHAMESDYNHLLAVSIGQIEECNNRI